MGGGLLGRMLGARGGKVDWLLVATVAAVLVGMVGGWLLSFARPSAAVVALVGFPGELFLNALKMLVLPLVALSVSSGVLSLSGTGEAMRRVVGGTLGFYAASTLAAVVLGVALVEIIHPGRGAVDSAGCQSPGAGEATAEMPKQGPALDPVSRLLGILAQTVPPNLVAAAAETNILGVISFSVFFAVTLQRQGEAARQVVDFVQALEQVFMEMVRVVLLGSPLGIGSLVMAKVMGACDLAGSLRALSLFMVTVLLALAVQGLVILPLIYFALTRRNPLRVLRVFSPAFVSGFGTDSSTAALPVTIECAESLGVPDPVSRFVLPLGATVNMNGTALYEALTVIFIAQAHGVELGLGGTLVVVLTSALAAVGAAAIPSAGLVTMLLVLQAAGLERFSGDIAIIFTVDWFLDRCRTVVNIAGDAFGVCVVQHWTRNLDFGAAGGGGGGLAGAGGWRGRSSWTTTYRQTDVVSTVAGCVNRRGRGEHRTGRVLRHMRNEYITYVVTLGPEIGRLNHNHNHKEVLSIS